MTPNTTVTLYATDFDITNKHVVFADSEGAALAAVSSFPSKIYANCYWQRTDGFVFRATGNINEVERFNYCVFENNGKRNFAFITKCQYINDDMTWVYLEIDPWLNFAGQYTFEASPMRRCHPQTDTVIEGSFTIEPLNVAGWKQENTTNGEYTTGDADDMFLVCQIDVSTLPTASNDLITGIFDLISYYGSGTAAGLTNWANLALKTSPTRIGKKTQATTYHVNRGLAGQILNKLAINGLGDKVICAYYVPSYFGSGNVGKSATPLASIADPPETTEIIGLDWGGATIFWNKVKYSPQFNELTLNLGGNSREVPWGFINSNSIINGNLTAKINSDLAQDGGATARIVELDIVANQSSDFLVHSPTWDRVQMVGTGANQNKLIANATATIGGIVRAGVSAMSFNPIGELQGLTDIMQTQSNLRDISNAGTVQTGGAGGTMSGFNRTAPLFNATHYFPKEAELVKIQKYFGTYGYSWGGEVKEIVFQNMPHWNYYETINAVITGRGVPQRYLNSVISMFNRGVFVYNNIGEYKKLNNAMSNHL